MNQAIEAGQLRHIRLTPPGVNEGGHYDSHEKAIYVSVDTFTKPGLEEPRRRIDVITSTLGHETGHALNTAESRKTLHFVAAQITEEIRAAGPGGSADVTPHFSLYQRAARRDEAIAEVEGLECPGQPHPIHQWRNNHPGSDAGAGSSHNQLRQA